MTTDDLDRKIALSIEPMPTSYDQTTPCFSPLRAWYRKSGPGKEPTWWQPRSFKTEPEMTLLLLEKGRLGVVSGHYYINGVLQDDDEYWFCGPNPGHSSRALDIRPLVMHKELPEAVRLAYARLEGLE